MNLFQFQFKIKLLRYEHINHNKDIYIENALRVTKFNKTQSVISGTAKVLRPMNLKEFDISLDGYQSVQNQYVKSLLSIPRTNLCELIVTDKFIFPDLKQQSNITMPDCVFKPGTYIMDNYHINPSDSWPKNVVGDKWKFSAKVWKKQTLLFEINIFVDVDRSEMIRNKLAPKGK